MCVNRKNFFKFFSLNAGKLRGSTGGTIRTIIVAMGVHKIRNPLISFFWKYASECLFHLKHVLNKVRGQKLSDTVNVRMYRTSAATKKLCLGNMLYVALEASFCQPEIVQLVWFQYHSIPAG